MGDMKHTPGEWSVVDQTIWALDETGTCNRFSANVQGGYVNRGQGWDKPERTSIEELNAVALVMGAARELLVALEAILEGYGTPQMDGWHSTPVHESEIAAARAAIAKARGQ